jgi:hypothetical protein
VCEAGWTVSPKNDEKTSELEHRFWALAFAKTQSFRSSQKWVMVDFFFCSCFDSIFDPVLVVFTKVGTVAQKLCLPLNLKK